MVLNKGVAGNNSAQLVQRVDKDVVAEKPDLVLIMVGTNDMINSQKFVSFDSYFANLKEVVSKIRAGSTATKIVLANVLPVDEDYLFQRHDKALYSLLPNNKLDSLNAMLFNFAKDNKLHFVDVNQDFRNENMSFKESSSLLINRLNGGVDDGVHPTKLGYELIANRFYDTLCKDKLLRRKMRIICFGDSITYGAFMEGKGTSIGDTYPAKLLVLLK